MKHFLLTLILLAHSVFGLAQSIIFVDASNSGTQNGTSWATAYADLQDAIDAASSGDSIFVAAGTYKPVTLPNGGNTDRDKAFVLKQGVHIYGGFAGTESSLTDRASDSTSLHLSNATILSGDIGTTGDTSDNCYHVVIGINIIFAHFNGFRVEEGHANGQDSIMLNGHLIRRYYGGGLYLKASNMFVHNTIFSNNIASRGGGALMAYDDFTEFGQTDFLNNRVNGNNASDPFGGGGAIRSFNSSLYVHDGYFRNNITRHNQGGGAVRCEEMSDILFRNTDFRNNEAHDGDGGGAVYCATNSHPDFEFVRFINNLTPNQGGGMYNDNSRPTLTDVQFIGNIGVGGAGAMENDGGSHAELTRVTFSGNATQGDGGAVQNWKSSPIFMDCLFENNSTANDGGAIFNYTECSPRITNSVFRNNSAAQNGGGIYNRRDCHPVMTNLLIYDNQAGNLGGGIYTAMSNSLPCSPVATNITLTSNAAGVSGGGAYDDGAGDSKLRNAIVFNNNAPGNPEVDAPASLAITALNRVVIGNDFYETGSTPPQTWSGPLFVDPLAADFRLAQGSVGIDAGDSIFYDTASSPDISMITTAIDGMERILGFNVDLGAYESCADTTVINVSIQASPNDSVADSILVTFNASVANATGNLAYQWYLNNAPLSGAVTDSLTLMAGQDFDSADVIQLVVSSDAFCLMEDSVWSNAIAMYIHPVNDTTDTSGNDSIDGIGTVKKLRLRIFPNPARLESGFTLEMKGMGTNGRIKLIDMRGYTQWQTEVVDNQEVTFPRFIPAGAYICRFENDLGISAYERVILLE